MKSQAGGFRGQALVDVLLRAARIPAIGMTIAALALACSGRKDASEEISSTRISAALVGDGSVDGDASAGTDQPSWVQLPIGAADARSNHAMAPLGSKIVVFGGNTLWGVRGDTWEWDGATWTRKEPANSPSARMSHAMATLGSKVVLFGGGAGSTALNDTWEWDGVTWTQLTPAHSPPKRTGHRMAALGGKLVLFGGSDGTTRLGDTWEWDGTDWTQRAVNGPAARHVHAMATYGNGVLLWGGVGTGVTFYSDTWEWNGSAWTQRNPAHVPGSRTGRVMVVLGAKALLYGGGSWASNDTWEWDGSDWTNTTGVTAVPASRQFHCMATLEAPGGAKVVLFGGQTGISSYTNETWEWDGTLWTERVMPAAPGKRAGHAVAVTTSGAQQKLVLFGGEESSSNQLQDTWEWDGTTWTMMNPGTKPPARTKHAMAALGTKVVLFGGAPYGGTSSIGDTWEWDGTAWTERAQTGTKPTSRQGHAMATLGTKVVVFGGYAGSGWKDDTWEWDGNGWVETNLNGTKPPARSGHSLVTVGSKLVLFGGTQDSFTKLNDIWEWDGVSWTPRPATGSVPVARSEHGAAALGGKMVLFGGNTTVASVRLGDTWEWSGTEWSQQTLVPSPWARSGHTLVGIGSGAFLFGGDTAGDYLQSPWRYRTISLPIGSPCVAGGDCASGFCADGYCCDRACSGQCEACDLAEKGTCATIISGAPRGARPACTGTGTTCGGSCDGASATACTYPTNQTPCRSASCASGTATGSANCDGLGNCPVVTTPCSPYICGANACTTTCAVDTDCATAHFCNAGSCVPRRDPGTACTESRQCKSGFCADGFCCNSACTGQCEACDVSGAEGTCSAVSGAPRGSRTACTGFGTTCGARCDGTNRTACVFVASTVSCRNSSCASGTETQAATCDGSGQCPAVQTRSCGTYICGATSCLTGCTTDADCTTGNSCSNGTCGPKKGNGASCSLNDNCQSGFCADGVCCNAACTGQCQACDVAGKIGTCSPVVGDPHGTRADCVGAGACMGACDGTEVSRCTYPGTSVQCAAPSCTGGRATAAATCDGVGQCSASTQTDCGAYACGTNQCRMDCTVDAHCASGNHCFAGVCTPPIQGAMVGGGCDCSTSGGNAGTLSGMALFLALAALRRRRRR